MCAGCDAYYPWTAASLGVIAAVFYLMGSLTLVALKIDDPLDAFPIHCIAGIHINMSISLTVKFAYSYNNQCLYMNFTKCLATQELLA